MNVAIKTGNNVLYLFGAMEIENPNCLSIIIKFHKISSYTKYQVQMDRARASESFYRYFISKWVFEEHSFCKHYVGLNTADFCLDIKASKNQFPHIQKPFLLLRPQSKWQKISTFAIVKKMLFEGTSP